MAERPTAGDYIANIKAAAPTMIAGIKELAAAEIKPSVKHAGIGSGLLGGAATFLLGALRFFMYAGGFGLAVFFYYVAKRGILASLGLGFLTMAVILLLLAALLGLLGRSQLSRVKAPTNTIAETKTAISCLTDSISAGSVDAKMGVIDRHGVGQPWKSLEESGATEARYVANPRRVADYI